MKEVYQFLDSLNISKNDYIVVGVSGGPDSMFLLYTLKSLNYKIVCAHVNHHLRKESDAEYQMVNNYCINNNNIIFEGKELFNLPKNNTEIVAREKRYEFFKEIIDKYHSKYLFTAHHGDDLMETILMRIVRGSYLNGYAGFNLITNKDTYQIIRPLVYLTKDYIINECNRLDIPYAIDKTNNDLDHLRNRYRHKILPILKSEDKNVHLKFLKYHIELQSYYDYVNKITYSYMNNIFKDNILDLDEYNKLDDLIKKNMLFEIIRKYYLDNLYLINDNNILEIEKCISSNKPNIKLKLPDNLYVIKEYNKLIFTRNINSKTINKIEFMDKLNINNYYFERVNNSLDNSNYIIRLNSKDIKLPLYFRSKIDGDVIEVKNLNNKKKVKEIFIENKIPVSIRESIPLLVDSNNNILWIPGIKKSKFDISNSKYYDIIITCKKKENNDEKE